MKIREMCPRTLHALATELERDAASFAGSNDDLLRASLKAYAERYRRRAKVARGGWLVDVEQNKGEGVQDE